MPARPAATIGTSARPLFDYRPYWAECYGRAPFLPTSRAEMDALGWDSCDVIVVTGDAYVDHPSFRMAIIGRLLEAHGFRVGIIAQARLAQQRPRSRHWAPPEPVLRSDCRQHGFDDQPLHGGSQDPALR